MADVKKILIAEDELTNSILLKRVLTKAGYLVVVAHNGLDAINHMERESFDALLTDWMMPQVDGIELIRRVRENIKPLPLIIMVTALVSEGAKNYALESGADDYIAKPIDVDDLLARVKDGLNRRFQPPPSKSIKGTNPDLDSLPPFVCVAVASSTGGPPALLEIFKYLPASTNASFLIVQHGPPWMLETFAQRLQKESQMNVKLAAHGISAEPGTVYLAPGDKHMTIEQHSYRILLNEGPKENFVRPAADPLFRSVATAFGSYSIGVILTGLGRDGAQGAYQISSVNGTIIVQDPETAVAPSMPKTVVEMGMNHKIGQLNEIGKIISETVFPIAAKLKSKTFKQ